MILLYQNRSPENWKNVVYIGKKKNVKYEAYGRSTPAFSLPTLLRETLILHCCLHLCCCRSVVQYDI